MSSSSGIRGIRRKKSSLSEVKIGIIGAPGVGKSALAVRFLTKRYIGEYDHQSETRYKHEILVDGEPILFEICDTCPKHETDMPQTENCINWADGFILVYSITDRSSFNYIKLVKQYITDMRQGSSSASSSHSVGSVGSGWGGNNGNSSPNSNSGSITASTAATATVASATSSSSSTSMTPSLAATNVPVVLVANKGDMVHLRQVASEEGEILAKDFDCYFAEVAAADQVNEIADAFHELCREVNNLRRKNKTSLLDRVLGKDKAGGGLRAYSKRGLSDSVLSN